MSAKGKKKILGGMVTALLAMMAVNVEADQIVKIGHVAPMTGGDAVTGKDSENGARLAIEEINQQGLVVDGKKVTLQLDAQDDANDPRQATQVAQMLVDDHVVSVVGHLNSGTSIPASKIYSDAGIVEISPAATNPAYTQQGFKTAYRVVATDAQQGPALAQYAHSIGIRSVVVVDDATAYGQGLANEFEKSARALGIKVLSHDATNNKAIDFRAILTKIKGENPDAVMYGGTFATGGPFAKQAQQLGIRARIFAGDGVCNDELPKLAGSAVANVTCSQAGQALVNMPGGVAFEKKYVARFHVPIEAYAPFSYDTVYIIAKAMKDSNSVDPAEILTAIHGSEFQYHGVTGDIRFDSHGDLRKGVISLYDFKNMKKTLVSTMNMPAPNSTQ